MCPFFTSGPQDIRNRTGCPYLSDLGYKVNLKVRLQQNYVKGDTSINYNKIPILLPKTLFYMNAQIIDYDARKIKLSLSINMQKDWNATNDE